MLSWHFILRYNPKNTKVSWCDFLGKEGVSYNLIRFPISNIVGSVKPKSTTHIVLIKW